MAHGEGVQSGVANPNRVTNATWQQLYARLGATAMPEKTQLTPQEIEELTTRVD